MPTAIGSLPASGPTERNHQHRGLGKALLDAVEQDATGTRGVAVVTSDKGFMANKTLFLKQGFEVVEEDGKERAVW